MKIFKRYPALITVAVMLIIVATWYIVSPWYTLGQIKDAADKHQAEKLSKYVDYPKLRENIKGQLKTRITSNSGPNSGNITGMVLMSGMMDTMVEALITPQMLEKILNEGSNSSTVDMDMERINFSRFDLIAKSKQPGHDIRGQFHREGLSWKLVGITLPDGLGIKPGKPLM